MKPVVYFDFEDIGAGKVSIDKKRLRLLRGIGKITFIVVMSKLSPEKLLLQQL